MYKMIFKNWKIAALFFVLTVMTATQLVGTQDQQGQLTDVQQQIAAQRQQFVEATMQRDLETENQVIEIDDPDMASGRDDGFSPSETLMDDAEGWDPTPPDTSDLNEINGPIREPAGPINGW